MAERFKAAFDGGSRGNPGSAAWGVVVIDGEGRTVEEHSGFIGHATNNVAEYQGLLEALRVAAECCASRVDLLADSELIVRQIRGQYRVRHPDLIPLHREAKRRIARFAEFTIEHIPRERNKAADRLVNRALDEAAAEAAGS